MFIVIWKSYFSPLVATKDLDIALYLSFTILLYHHYSVLFLGHALN
jgi:hypothetical protein